MEFYPARRYIVDRDDMERIAANVFHLIEKLRERRGRENTAMDVTVGEPRLLARHLKCLQKRPRPLSQTLGQNLRVPGLITNERGPLQIARIQEIPEGRLCHRIRKAPQNGDYVGFGPKIVEGITTIRHRKKKKAVPI